MDFPPADLGGSLREADIYMWERKKGKRGIRRLFLGSFFLERSRRKSESKREEEQNRRDGSQGFRLVLGVGAASLKSSTPCCRGDFQVWLLWVFRLCHLSCFSHLFLKWFLHCLLDCYGLVIVALIFLFSGSIKEIFDYASVYCFILEELVAFCAFLLRHLPWISPLIVKPMDTIMKRVQHVWWIFYALLFSLSFALSLYSSVSSSFEKVWDAIIGRLALDKYWGWSCYGYLHKATRRMEDQWGYIVYAQDCGIWNLCCCIAGDVDRGHNTFENRNLKVSDFEWALLRNLNVKMIGFTQLKGTHQELQVQNLDYAISHDPFLHSLPFFIQVLASGRYPSHNMFPSVLKSCTLMKNFSVVHRNFVIPRWSVEFSNKGDVVGDGNISFPAWL